MRRMGGKGVKKWDLGRGSGGRAVAARLARLVTLATLTGLAAPGWASAQVSARVYVANRQAATLSVIDARTATVIAPAIAVGNGPSAVVPTRDGRFAYVLNKDSDSVSVIDGATLAVIQTIALPAGSGLQTAALTFSANESELLVAGESVGKIFRIDVETHTLKPPAHEIGVASGHFALSGNDLFIGRPDGTLLETFLFDTTLQIHSYPLPAVVNEIALNAFSVYVSHPGLNTLSRVSLDQLVAPVELGFVPSQILMNDSGKLFAAGGAAHVVRIIDAFTAATIDTIDVVRETTRIALSPDGKTLYVSHGPDDSVSVVDIATHVVSAPIAVGDLPGAIAVGPATIVNDGLNTGVTLTSAEDDLSTRGFFNYLPFADGGILRASAAPFGSLRLKPVLLGGDGIVDTGAGTLELNVPYGAGRLVKRGAGTLDISCDNQSPPGQTGRILVEAGSLRGCAEKVDVVLNAGTTLAAETDIFANVTAAAGSIVDLQGFGLRANTVTLAAGTTLRPHVMSGGALTPTVATHLNGATLDLVMPPTNNVFFRPPNGWTFTVATRAQGTFAGLGEGALLATSRGRLRLSYAGGDAHNDVTLTFVDVAPTIDWLENITVFANFSRTVQVSIGDDLTPAADLVVTAVSSNQAVIADSGLTIGGSGAQRTLTITPAPGALGVSTIRVRVSDGTFFSDSEFVVTVKSSTYYLSEGATGSFFDTDLLLANPNAVAAPVSISFLMENGGVIVQERTLPPTSRTTIRVADLDGLAAAAFSIKITSKTDLSIVAERTMRWDASGYGSHTEAAVPDPQTHWYFAEGSQGAFFSTFLLLSSGDGTKFIGGLPPIVQITFFREGAAPVERQYQMPSEGRLTIDVSTIPELANTSFGIRVACFPTCAAERVMYFGQPLFSGGTAAAGATAPSREWFLAEGATGSYFNTYVLLTNPDQDHDANVTLTYLPASGEAVTKQVTLGAGRRMTRDIATEDPALASAAVSTRVQSDIPLVVERAQYWPTPTWHEGHASIGMTETRRHWGLAEGRVGGANADQTYILLANPGNTEAEVTLTFLRDAGSGSGGSTLEKTFTVPPTSRFNVSVAGPESSVPELVNESFGVDIVSTQPIAVERSMYSNANGVIWAAGTNAAASRLP